MPPQSQPYQLLTADDKYTPYFLPSTSPDLHLHSRHITHHLSNNLKFPDEAPRSARNPFPDTDPIMAVRDATVRTPFFSCGCVI